MKMSSKTKERVFLTVPIAIGLVCAISYNAILGFFGFRMVIVRGHSMDDTLRDGQQLIARESDEITNGDIIVCDSKGLNENIIKRVIAVGGQTIDIDFDRHTVTVDGVVLDEPYIKEPTSIDAGGFEYPVIVPNDCYFVMGDNRNDSIDSRDARVGFISSEDIIGKIKLKQRSDKV